MKDRSHHGVGFLAGLLLALSLAAPACVAGEVGDEDEVEAARSAPEAVEIQEPPAAEPPARAERAPAAVEPVRRASPAAMPTVKLRDDARRRPPHRLEDALAEPPPNPW
jgi:hypothetical protein